MAGHEAEALSLEARADKKRNGFQFFGNKYEDAFEMYERAGGMFKLAKKWQNAGEVYTKAAECQIKLDSKHEAATKYVEAANCFKKVSNPDAVDRLKLACDIFIDLGRFSQSAKLQKDIAAIYESEVDLEHAIEHYESAADFFSGEESHGQAAECLLKVGQFCAQLEKYDRAIDIYEKVAADSVENTLRKFSVRDYLLRAGLCQLCTGDIIRAKRANERYGEMDPSFPESREGKLLRNLCDTVERQDVDGFLKAIHEFDSISKFSPWHTTLLLRIRKSISGAEDTQDFT